MEKKKTTTKKPRSRKVTGGDSKKPVKKWIQLEIPFDYDND